MLVVSDAAACLSHESDPHSGEEEERVLALMILRCCGISQVQNLMVIAELGCHWHQW
jgi:hypothetical protein